MLLEEQGDAVGAREAYQRAVDSGHTDVVQAAAVNLGVLLRDQGDLAGARSAFHLAIDSGYVDLAPVAAGSRRVLLTEQGGTVSAQAAYQLAVDVGHSQIAGIDGERSGNGMRSRARVPEQSGNGSTRTGTDSRRARRG
jgi:predicted negative regulator of RcsB-dependent stress response